MRWAVRRTIFPACVAAAAAFAAGGAVAGAPKVGKAAPDFHATLYGGRKVSLADYKGQVLVVNFWATWCGPCKTELPLLDSYAKLMKAQGLQVLAVASADSAEPYLLKPLAAKLTIPLVSRLQGPYDVLGGYPTNYIIDRAGIVRYAKANAFTLDALNALLVPMLNEPAPEATLPPAAAPTPAP